MMEKRVKEHLIQVYSLSEKDVEELYVVGCATVLGTLDRLDNALCISDLAAFAEASHMLKGTLFNMGLDDLAELAKSLEREAKDGNVSEVEVFFLRLRAALRGFE